MKLPRFLTAVGAAMALTFITNPSALAHEGHDHDHSHGAANIPDSADAIFAEIQKHHSALTTAVNGKNLKVVHDHAEAMTALAKALPDKVAEDKKTRVQGSANNLAKLADTLHHAADDGDQARAGIELKKLDGVVMALEKQVK